MDILIEATKDNAERLLAAMIEARLGTATMITADELLAKEIIIFQDRIRIDVQTKTPGIEFASAWQHRETMTYQNRTFYVLSREDLIASKRAAGRAIDLEDVRLLELE